jgi:hypothetical protein
LNGRKVADAKGGAYYVIARRWKRGDVVRLSFDMTPRLWVGERECRGRVSVYRGPLLLAYDRRFDSHDVGRMPTLDLSKPGELVVGAEVRWPRPMLLMRFRTTDGGSITLCDYATAGATGTHVVSWMLAPDIRPVPFSRRNPLRRRTID